MNKSLIKDCSIIQLPVKQFDKATLALIENDKQIPFSVRRIYYLYDVPPGESRGGHAHKELKQLIVAASGSFDVILFDGVDTKIYNLNHSSSGLLIIPGIWRELNNFSLNSVCLVLASHEYDEDDYIRDYNDFIKWKAL